MEQDPYEEADSTLLDNDKPSASNRRDDRSSSASYSAQAASSRGQPRSEQASSYPTAWSDWEWNVQYNCYSRYRQLGPDQWDWEYGQLAAEPSTTEGAPITQSRTSSSQPISFGSNARPPDAVEGITEGFAQTTLNSLPNTQHPSVWAGNHYVTTAGVTQSTPNYLPSAQQYSSWTREGTAQSKPTYSPTRTQPPYITKKTSVTTEEFDPHYKVQAAWQFKVGKIFKILWLEPRGADSSGRTASSKEIEAFHSVRRFVIVNAMEGHCICLPIMTYGRQGTNKRGVHASTHAIIYSGKKPVAYKGENFIRKPIKALPSSPRHKMGDASRLNYAKVYTVEYNVKVWFIGEIHPDSSEELMKNFAEVQSLRVNFEPLPNTESPSQSTHKILHSAYHHEMASRRFFKKGRVFSTPYPEVAGPFTTESNEITLDPYHNKLHTKIRRCIIVREMSSHCLCVPVNTYGGRDNHTAKPQDQYQLFPAGGNEDKSRIAKKELPLIVEASDVDVDYNLASVDFTRILTVKHYALVKNIGRIDKPGLPLLEECFRNALGVPLELDDNNPAFVSMYSPTYLKWYGLIASVHGGYEGNFISKNVVDRLRLSYASVQSWADGVERPSVTPTFSVARNQVSQSCLFHVVNNVDYDVCFGRAFVQEHKTRYTQLYNLMYPSDSHHANQVPPPESSTDDFMLSPPSHSYKLPRDSKSLPGDNMPASSSNTTYNQHQNAGAYEDDEGPPYEEESYDQEAPYEEPWQEEHHHGPAFNLVGSTSSAQLDDIYDDN